MSADEFAKLFAYIEKRFDSIEAKLDDKADKSDVDKILHILDDIANKQEVSDSERIALGHHLERVDRWVHQIAKEIGYKLPA